LVNLGTNAFMVEEGVTTASYSQTEDALAFSNTYGLGDTLGGLFAEQQDWSHYDSFGIRMTLEGANPELFFTVEFYDEDFAIINTYQGNTAGLSFIPAVVMLDLSLANNGDFALVDAMQFTWNGQGAINTSLTEVVGFDAPATEGFFVVRARAECASSPAPMKPQALRLRLAALAACSATATPRPTPPTSTIAKSCEN
jgi:hypothetical protein